MIKHVVMWKLKNEAEGNSLEINRRLVREKLEGLMDVIPEIDSLEVGLNISSSDAAFDMVLITTHKSAKDLQQYVIHDAHKAVAGFIGNVTAERKVVDFEY